MMKSFLRVFFSLILALFLAITAFAGGACYFVDTVACNPSTLVKTAKDCGFTQELYDEVVYDWENLLSITGVTEPESIMVVLTKEQVAQDVLSYIADSFTGTPTVNTDALREELETKVREYAYSHNVHATPEAELEENIDELVSACITDYEDAIHIPLLPTILRYTVKIRGYCPKLIPFIAAASFVLILFLFFLQKKKQDFFYYASISAATGGIVLIAAKLIANHYSILERLPFTDSAVKTLVVRFLEALLDEICQFGFYYLMAAGGLLAIYLMISLLIRLIRKSKPVCEE